MAIKVLDLRHVAPSDLVRFDVQRTGQPLPLVGTGSIAAFDDGLNDGTGAAVLGSAPTAPLSSEHAGGFTGVLIGMFAEAGENNQPADMPPADFDWFEYQPDVAP